MFSGASGWLTRSKQILLNEIAQGIPDMLYSWEYRVIHWEREKSVSTIL